MSISLKNPNFIDIKQVFSINRVRESKKTGKKTEETVYGGHLQSEDEKLPQQILLESRSHWAIENREHYVRDVTFDEDKSKIRTGNGPHMMAILRNLALNIMRSRGIKNVREKIIEFSHSPVNLLNYLNLTPLTLKILSILPTPKTRYARR